VNWWETRDLLASVPEEQRYEPRAFWERIYEAALIGSMQKLGVAPPRPTESAVAIADEALRRWLERWHYTPRKEEVK